MSPCLDRTRVPCVALLLVLGWLLSSAGATAQDRAVPVRPGDYDGLWTGTKVRFSIQEVHPNQTFDGIAEFTEGRFQGIKFGIHGRLSVDGTLTVTRYVAGDTQVARVGTRQHIDGNLVWQGETRGVGLPEGASWPFELRIPQ